MTTRILDPFVFTAQGALITIGDLLGAHLDAGVFPTAEGLQEIPDATRDTMREQQGRVLMTYLRWQVSPEIGLPSEPFKVWRRPALPMGEVVEARPQEISLGPNARLYQFDQPMMSVDIALQAGNAATSVLVMAFNGAPEPESLLHLDTIQIPANSFRRFTYQVAALTNVVIIGQANVLEFDAIPVAAAQKLTDWELVETVGFPIEKDQWADLPDQNHGVDQGLVAAPLPARAAALQRFTRGVNSVGWPPFFPTGEQAPLWELPNAEAMIDDAMPDLMRMVHEALRLPPQDQASHVEDFLVHPPENTSGDRMSGRDGKGTVSALALLQMAVSSDPLQAVALGFGTGYMYQDIPTVNIGDRALFGNSEVSDWDYMVTGLWAKGLSGTGEPVEYAALIPRPGKVYAAPAPASTSLTFLSHSQPSAPDRPWTAGTRFSWDRAPLTSLNRLASFAFARHNTASSGPADALMEKRPSAPGFMPIGNSQASEDDPAPHRHNATDGGFPIPNQPGSVNARYGVATQNIFGIWSPWASEPFSSTQPKPDTVQIVEAKLRPFDTGSGTICPADLVMDIVVDWRVRSVAEIEFRGRMFAAATRKTQPPPGAPAGLMKSLGSADPTLKLTFSGDTLTFPLGQVQHLDALAEKEVSPGFAGQGHARRYRITIPGFSLDYASTPHIGLNLQGRLTERIAPQRQSAWSPRPMVTYASDPRSRATTVLDAPQLASLPDASGVAHVRLDWASVSSATGYIIYESNETKILAHAGQSEAEPGSVTPAQRLDRIKTLFRNNPERKNFTRLNTELLEKTSLDVSLPRGSQQIHVYVIIPVSAGGIEGPWPSGALADKSLIAYIAPRIAVPAPPTLEVRRVEQPAGFAAELTVQTRPKGGAAPTQIDLYRTRVTDAAQRVDSMGPPIARVTANGGAWSLKFDGSAITEMAGTDTPAGSWKTVWYRAVAWSDDDMARAVRRGRSDPSQAVPVVVPPNGPPDLSMLTKNPPSGPPTDIELSFTSKAPIWRTPLGSHVLRVDAKTPGAAEALIAFESDLTDVSDAALVGKSSVWRLPDGLEENYRILLRRADQNDPVEVTLSLSDPLGRISVQTFRIEPGPVFPLPDLERIDRFTISGRGTFFTTSTDAPLEDFDGQFYALRVILTPEDFEPERPILRPNIPILPRDRFTPIPRQPERFRPRVGPMLDLGAGRVGSQFRRDGETLVFSGPLRSLPSATERPDEEQTFSIARQSAGGKTAIIVVAKRKVERVEIEIITPDGRKVTQTARG